MADRDATLAARTTSVEETRALAAALTDVTEPGDLVLLGGDLGAGKTAFVQGFGRGMGVQDPITSPTFTLAQEYDGRLRLHHLDVYRLDHLAEVTELGLPELLDDEGVVLIEWGEAIVSLLPHDYLEVWLRFGDADDERHILLRQVGTSWRARHEAVAKAIAPWAEADGRQPC